MIASSAAGNGVRGKGVLEGESVVDAHFAAEIRNTLTCRTCGYSRDRVDMHRHLSLEVGGGGRGGGGGLRGGRRGDGGVRSVKEGLQKYFED